MHVFTYGSLMFPEVWNIVVGREFATVQGTLPGYSVFRVEGAAYPGIIAATPDCSVSGLVYLNVDAISVERLDRFEGEFYARLPLSVRCADGKSRNADAYTISDEHQHVLTSEPWTAEWFASSGGLAGFIAQYQGFSRLGGAG
jgi:gamma-glutamylcyclotransferase (GGCT)/AIG2-like uncharacterized protein YtfP